MHLYSSHKLKSCFLVALLSISSVVISSCSSSDSTSTTATESSALAGTAAVGAAIEGFVYAKDATGTEVNVASGVDGSFTLDATSLQPTIMLKVVPNDGSDTQYSFATSNSQTINLTPMTSLAVFIAGGSSSLEDIYNNWDGTAITETSVTEAQAVLNANFYDQIVEAGLDPTTYDFMTSEFAADGTGIDGVLDNLSISIDENTDTFTVADTTDGTFVFDENIDTSGITIGEESETSSDEVIASIPDGFLNVGISSSYSENDETSPIANGLSGDFVTGDSTTDGLTITIVNEVLVLTNPVIYKEDATRIIFTDEANQRKYILFDNGIGNFDVDVTNNVHFDEEGYVLYGTFEHQNF